MTRLAIYFSYGIIMAAVAGMILGHYNRLNADADPNMTVEQTEDPNLPYTNNSNDTVISDAPVNPMPVHQDPPRPSDDQLFKVGQRVTCIYEGVFSWSDGNEFVKAIPIICNVLKVTEPEDMSSYGQSAFRQNIQVDCTKDVDFHTGSRGVGLVPKHKLNVKIRWYATEDCYHFVQEN